MSVSRVLRARQRDIGSFDGSVIPLGVNSFMLVPITCTAEDVQQWMEEQGWTPLMQAINRLDDSAAVRLLMTEGPDIHVRDSMDGVDALWLAVANNRAPLVRMLLAAGADPTCHGLQALLDAAAAGHARQEPLGAWLSEHRHPALAGTWHRVTREALEAWFSQHRKLQTPTTPVPSAAGSTATADASAPSSLPSTAQAAASSAVHFNELLDHICSDDVLAVAAMLDQGVDPNLTDTAGLCNRDSLLTMAAWCGSPALVHLLLSRGANVHSRDGEGNTALASMFTSKCNCRHTNRVQTLRLLLQAGSDVNATNYMDQSALLLATRTAAASTLEVVRELIASGAKVDTIDLYGSTPFREALCGGDLHVIQELLNAGADPNGRLCSIEPPLVSALLMCRRDPRCSLQAMAGVVSALLQRGADPTLPSHGGFTALHAACLTGNLGAIRLLLEGGAIPTVNVQAFDKRATPLMYALLTPDNLEAVRLLLAAGADPELRCLRGATALLLAANQDDLEAVELLLTQGKADPTAVDNKGKGALDLAAGPAVFKLLQKAITQHKAQAALAAARLEAELAAAALLAEEAEDACAADAARVKKDKKARKKAKAREQQEKQRAEQQRRQQEEEEQRRRQQEEQQRRQQEEQQRRLQQQRQQEQEQERRQQQQRRHQEEQQRRHQEEQQRRHQEEQQRRHQEEQKAQQQKLRLRRLQQQHTGQPSTPPHVPPSAVPAAPTFLTTAALSALHHASSLVQTGAPPHNTRAVPGQQLRQPPTVDQRGLGISGSRDDGDESCCVVCMEADRNVALVPCGHVALCVRCCEAVQEATNECPMCRSIIDAVLELRLA